MASMQRLVLQSAGRRIVGQRARKVQFSTASLLTSTHNLPCQSSLTTTIRTRCANAGSARFLSDAAAATTNSSEESDTSASLSSPKLQGLYDRVVDLPEEDVNVLGALALQVLGRKIFPGEFGGGGGAAVMPGGEEGAAGAVAVEEAEAKTIFDLKLVGFDAKAKIKVIKEVRAIAGLGLKEAKELVESAPKVIQKDLKQETADELKAQLEAVGAEIEVV